jgi:hypothetical protein
MYSALAGIVSWMARVSASPSRGGMAVLVSTTPVVRDLDKKSCRHTNYRRRGLQQLLPGAGVS